jgi:hypothetical protein
MKLFSEWLVRKSFISSGDDPFGATVPKEMPYLIAAWIMDRSVNATTAI